MSEAPLKTGRRVKLLVMCEEWSVRDDKVVHRGTSLIMPTPLGTP